MKHLLCDLFGFGCGSPYAPVSSSTHYGASIASVPEIAVSSGTAAVAIVIAALLLTRELRQRGTA